MASYSVKVNIWSFIFCAILTLNASAQNKKLPYSTDMNAQVYKQLAAKQITLPNQWKLTPVGEQLPLGDLPLNAVFSPTKKLLAITNNGVAKHYIQLFNTETGIPVQCDEKTIKMGWYGLAFSDDAKKLYASGGNENVIIVFNIEKNKLNRDTVITLGKPWSKDKICAAGIAVDGAQNKLFTVTKEDSTLYVCNTITNSVEKKIKLPSEPFCVLVSKKRNELYVSLWGEKKIRVFDLATQTEKGDIQVGDHPNELILDKKQTHLFVANAQDNSVSIINLKSKKVVEVLNAALYANSPNGSTTNSLALTDDEKTLYIANADNNCLAVFNVAKIGKSYSLGFIPTGWYPTNVKILGTKILVVNGKGLTSKANPSGPSPLKKRADSRGAEYIGSLFLGTLATVEIPDAKTLAAYSRLVYENTPYTKAKELNTEGEKGNPIPMHVGDTSPIKYVFYIIKENRTYDQVLSDLPQGNGDTSLCLFPRKITPNQHAISENFVLYDNFYDDAEVSADGHNWSTAAYANDFVEKTWPTSYGGKGGNYDFEGTRKIAFPKGGFIWDYCKRANITYRTYGEFVDNKIGNYPTLVGHVCPKYGAFDLNYKDVTRENDWEHDFDSLLNINAVPRFNSLRVSNDHTSGLSRGAYSPFAAVADNDLAVGKFIEHLSQSKIWAQSAVFILEDDAQNGSDHVDAHRSTAYVASPYLKRNFVDHTMYSTSSMLRTIELILGLPPMSQYDAAATPMWRSFSSTPDFSTFKAIDANINIFEKNVADNELSRQSDLFNLAKADAVDDIKFNEILWKAVKGINAEVPAPRRAAFVAKVAEKDND